MIESHTREVCSQKNNHQREWNTFLNEIFVGGDQLSEEKARHVQGAMAGGETKLDRPQGLIPKNEDWHAIRYMYVVSEICYVYLLTAIHLGLMLVSLGVKQNFIRSCFCVFLIHICNTD